MSRELRTKAVILDTTDVYDADRSYLMWTREFGKLRARARGVRRPTSRLTGHLLRFMPTELSLVESHGWYTITKASGTGGSYPDDSLTFLGAVELLAEGLDMLTVEREANPTIYDALEFVAVRLREASNPILLVSEFLLKCLVRLGYSPQLHNSVMTQAALQPDQLVWSSELGGVLNRSELDHHDGLVINDPKTIVLLRQLVEPDFITERLKVDLPIAQEAERIILRFVQFHAGKDMKSARYLEPDKLGKIR